MSNLFYGPRLIKELVESSLEGFEVKFTPGPLEGQIQLIVTAEDGEVVADYTANDEDEMVSNLGKAWAKVNDTPIEDF